MEVAASFVAGFNGTLDSIRVATNNGSSVDSYVLSLASSNISGVPGAPLETFSGLAFPGPVPGIVAVTSLAHPALLAGSTYWVVITATNPVVTVGNWFGNDQGISGSNECTRNIAFSLSWSCGGSTSPAFEVNASAAVPETGTLSMTFVGLAALVIRRRASRAV